MDTTRREEQNSIPVFFFAKMWMWMPYSNKGMTNIHHATLGRDKKLDDREKNNTWKRIFFEENDGT